MADDNRSDGGSDPRSDKPDLDRALRELSAAERAAPGEHPDPEALLDYHEGRLAEAEADRVQEHLVRCPDCARAVLDFKAFPHLEPPGEEYRLTPAEIARRRRDLEARLAARARPPWQRHQVLLPLAAAFLAAAIGLGLWAGRLQERIARLSGPRGDVYVVGALRPEGAGLRGGEPREVPRWAGRVLVFLALPPGEREHPAYEVDLETAAGHPVAAGISVERSPEGLFVLDLPRELAPPGEYAIELFGIEGGQRTRLARYPMALEGERR